MIITYSTRRRRRFAHRARDDETIIGGPHKMTSYETPHPNLRQKGEAFRLPSTNPKPSPTPLSPVPRITSRSSYQKENVPHRNKKGELDRRLRSRPSEPNMRLPNKIKKSKSLGSKVLSANRSLLPETAEGEGHGLASPFPSRPPSPAKSQIAPQSRSGCVDSRHDDVPNSGARNAEAARPSDAIGDDEERRHPALDVAPFPSGPILESNRTRAALVTSTRVRSDSINSDTSEWAPASSLGEVCFDRPPSQLSILGGLVHDWDDLNVFPTTCISTTQDTPHALDLDVFAVGMNASSTPIPWTVNAIRTEAKKGEVRRTRSLPALPQESGANSNSRLTRSQSQSDGEESDDDDMDLTEPVGQQPSIRNETFADLTPWITDSIISMPTIYALRQGGPRNDNTPLQPDDAQAAELQSCANSPSSGSVDTEGSRILTKINRTRSGTVVALNRDPPGTRRTRSGTIIMEPTNSAKGTKRARSGTIRPAPLLATDCGPPRGTPSGSPTRSRLEPMEEEIECPPDVLFMPRVPNSPDELQLQSPSSCGDKHADQDFIAGKGDYGQGLVWQVAQPSSPNPPPPKPSGPTNTSTSRSRGSFGRLRAGILRGRGTIKARLQGRAGKTKRSDQDLQSPSSDDPLLLRAGDSKQLWL